MAHSVASDLELHCLPLIQQSLDRLTCKNKKKKKKLTCLKLQDKYDKEGVPIFRLTEDTIIIIHVQSNFTGSNTFGAKEIC